MTSMRTTRSQSASALAKWSVGIVALGALILCPNIPAHAKRDPGLPVRVHLGVHNFQTSDAWPDLSGTPQLVSRLNCDPSMTSSVEQTLAATRKQLEGQRGLFVGCRTGPEQWKYQKGPMSGAAGSEDVFGPGTAATPTVSAFRRWMRSLQSTLGHKVWRFQVWNEGNLGGFYRGSPDDLVDLTFAAARIFGRKRVLAPSFTMLYDEGPSGGWHRGRNLSIAEYPGVYWRLLARRAASRGVPLPVSAATYNGYGGGATVDEAAESRHATLRKFRDLVIEATGKRDISFIDTEWNLRDTSSSSPGFPDTPATARVWRESAIDAACLGFRWQFIYLWTDRPTLEGWLSDGIQFSPQTVHVNDAFRRTNGKKFGCEAE